MTVCKKRGCLVNMKLSYIAGYLLYHVIGNHLPKSDAKINFGSKQIRAFAAKLMLTRVGKHVNIEREAHFSRTTEIGDYSGIGENCRLYGRVIIGDYVMMGRECFIYTYNHETSRTDIPMQKQGGTAEKTVSIGNDVWIGSRVTILPGVTIGNGAIIGASSVVTKDVPPYAVACGNPAKVVKYRETNI